MWCLFDKSTWSSDNGKQSKPDFICLGLDDLKGPLLVYTYHINNFKKAHPMSPITGRDSRLCDTPGPRPIYAVYP